MARVGTARSGPLRRGGESRREVKEGPDSASPPAVYIGRFQPPHDAHIGTMLDALEHAPRLTVLPGSANLARSAKNPWTAPERIRMIRSALLERGVDLRRVRFRPIPDEFDSVRWAAHVRAAVQTERAVLVGFEKDASSSYLRWFPEWTDHESPVTPGLNATGVRVALFGDREVEAVPPAAHAFLNDFRRTRTFRRLQAEHFALLAARAAWDGHPVHEVLLCDVHHDAVTLHRRTGPIGRGLWELPRLSGNAAPPEGARVFDHPSRSLVVPATAHVVTGRAAGERVPLALALARPHRFFEDHHVILRRMLGL